MSITLKLTDNNGNVDFIALAKFRTVVSSFVSILFHNLYAPFIYLACYNKSQISLTISVQSDN